ncbi:15425_t:CDS:1, partial [Gigaspora rosea]
YEDLTGLIRSLIKEGEEESTCLIRMLTKEKEDPIGFISQYLTNFFISRIKKEGLAGLIKLLMKE